MIRAVFIDASDGPTVVLRVAPLRGWRLVTKNSGRLCSERQGGDSQDFPVWVPRVVSLSAVALLLAAVQSSVLAVVGEKTRHPFGWL